MPESESNSFAEAAKVLASIADQAHSAGETQASLESVRQQLADNAGQLEKANAEVAAAQEQLSQLLKGQIEELGRRLHERYAELKGQNEAFRSTLDTRLNQEIGNLSRAISDASSRMVESHKQTANQVSNDLAQLKRKVRNASVLAILIGLAIGAGVTAIGLKLFGHLP